MCGVHAVGAVSLGVVKGAWKLLRLWLCDLKHGLMHVAPCDHPRPCYQVWRTNPIVVLCSVLIHGNDQSGGWVEVLEGQGQLAVGLRRLRRR
jgi:hypothetical protein